MAERTKGSWWQRNWRWLVSLYLALLTASHITTDLLKWGESEPEPPRQILEVQGKTVGYLEWGKEHGGIPLILVHGSPSGGAADFRSLAPVLAKQGRWVIAVDRWGWGSTEKWVDDYSFLADANLISGLMDQLGIARAHLGGWSYGGGPALILAERDPDRVQSVTLLAAIGIQEGEGSGNYYAEQAKYAVGYPLIMSVGELVPHFGLLGTRASRNAFMSDFRECDQRELGEHLKSMEPPLLIVHGRKDPLVPSWVAQKHYELRPQSRLVMLEASHFFPMEEEGGRNLQITASEIGGFLKAVEKETIVPEWGVRDETGWEDVRAVWKGGPPLRGFKPLWAVAGVTLICSFFFPRWAAFLAGIGGGLLVFDFLSVLILAMIGGLPKRRETIGRWKLAGVMGLLGMMGILLGGAAMMRL